MTLNYEGRTFGSVANTPNGEVDGRTLFRYHHEGEIVWATYAGGSIRFGTLVAQVNARGELDMRYQHLNQAGEWRTGRCHSIPEILPDGRLRLHERWQWTSGDHSAGESVIEEL